MGLELGSERVEGDEGSEQSPSSPSQWIGVGFAVMVGLWGFFMVVCSGLMVDYGSGIALCSGFLIFFFFFILHYSNTVKYFSDYFPKCNQTQEKNYFP